MTRHLYGVVNAFNKESRDTNASRYFRRPTCIWHLVAVSWSVVICCLLSAAGFLWFVYCRLLVVVCWLRLVACRLLVVVCRFRFVGSGLLGLVCWL